MFSTHSSLVASDGKALKKSIGGLFKRKSKQQIAEKKMFGARKGSHGVDLKIGKKFKKIGKDTGKKAPISASSIGPTDLEFDDMLNESVTHDPNKKKTPFKRKLFG